MKIELKVLFLVVILMVSHVAKGQFIPITPGEALSSITEYPYTFSGLTYVYPRDSVYMVDNIVRNYKDSVEVLYEYQESENYVTSRFYIREYDSLMAKYIDISNVDFTQNSQATYIKINDVQIVDDYCYFCGVEKCRSILGVVNELTTQGILGRFSLNQGFNMLKPCEIVGIPNVSTLEKMAIYQTNSFDSVVVDMIGNINDTIALIKIRTDSLLISNNADWNYFYEYLQDPNEVLTDVLATPSYLITSSYFKNSDSVGIRYRKWSKSFFDMDTVEDDYISDYVLKYNVRDMGCNYYNHYSILKTAKNVVTLDKANQDDFLMTIAGCDYQINRRPNQGAIVCKMDVDSVKETHFLGANSHISIQEVSYLSQYDMATVLMHGKLSHIDNIISQIRFVHFGKGNECLSTKDTIFYLTDSLHSIDSYKNRTALVSGANFMDNTLVGRVSRYASRANNGCYKYTNGSHSILKKVPRTMVKSLWKCVLTSNILRSQIKNCRVQTISVNNQCVDNGHFGRP